jgi:hypothetical protein
MRLGCGCLIGLIVIVGALAGAGWIALNLLAEPDAPRIATTAADAQRAQQKIYSIVSGSGRGRAVVLSEAEVNAFLERNLGEAADFPVSDLRVRLADPERVRITGRTTLGALLAGPPLPAIRDVLPGVWLAWPAWIELAARPATEIGGGRRRYLRLDVRELRVGRQRLPAVLAKMLLPPGSVRLLRWPLPQSVEEVTIEPGRVVIRTAS